MDLQLWQVMLIAVFLLFIIVNIFVHLVPPPQKQGLKCNGFLACLGMGVFFFGLFTITLLLTILALSCFGVTIQGIQTFPAAAANTAPMPPAPVFIDLPVTTHLSEVRNHNFTIMNFDTFVPTYNWSKEEPFKPSGKVGKTRWTLQAWNMPKEKIHLQVTIYSGTGFYDSSFYELKIVNRDTENVTFKESGFGSEWGRILVTKDCLEKSLDKEGSLHFVMSFALNGTKQGDVQRIKDEEGIKITYPTAKPIKKPKGIYSIRGTKLAGEKNGTGPAALTY